MQSNDFQHDDSALPDGILWVLNDVYYHSWSLVDA